MTHEQPTPQPESHHAGGRSSRWLRLPSGALFVSGLACVALLLGGCSGSKPAFCSHVAELKTSVRVLGRLGTVPSISALEGDLRTIDSNAKAVVSSAKSEFPRQTAAVEKSLMEVNATVKEVSSDHAAHRAGKEPIGKLLGQAGAAFKAVTEFVSATKSKCS